MDAHYAIPPHWAQDPLQKTDGMSACRDGYDRCVEWASEGECKANSVWMMGNCQKSCHTCPIAADYEHLDQLDMTGTALFEPNCKDFWCSLSGAVKWSGPGEKDTVITAGNKYRLWPDKDEL